MDQAAGEAAECQGHAGDEEPYSGRPPLPTPGQDPGRLFSEFHKSQCEAGQKRPLPERQHQNRLTQSGQMPGPLSGKLIQAKKSIRGVRQKKQADPDQTSGATDPTLYRPNRWGGRPPCGINVP